MRVAVFAAFAGLVQLANDSRSDVIRHVVVVLLVALVVWLLFVIGSALIRRISNRAAGNGQTGGDRPHSEAS